MHAWRLYWYDTVRIDNIIYACIHNVQIDSFSDGFIQGGNNDIWSEIQGDSLNFGMKIKSRGKDVVSKTLPDLFAPTKFQVWI